MELSDLKSKFDELGINLRVMTYDSAADALKFHKQFNLGFPILQDVNAEHVRALGILNENYSPGHKAYGIPHPGMFLVGSDGIVFRKFSEEGYINRPAFELVLQAAREMSGVSNH